MQQSYSLNASASFAGVFSSTNFQGALAAPVEAARTQMVCRDENPDGRYDLHGDRLEDWERYKRERYGDRLEDWEDYEPQGRVVWRPSKLLNEVSRLYEAQSFLTWRYGEFFNTHVTITPRLMWIEDHREFATLMTIWNKEMKRWLAVGKDKPRQRWTKRVRAKTPQEHLWIYVFEHGRLQVLHAHELCIVPSEQVKAFREHTMAWWSRKACMDIPDEAIRVEHRPGSSDRDRYKRQVQWFRYIVKSADRSATMPDADGILRTMEEVIKPEPYWNTEPVYTPQLYGICQKLSFGAQTTPVIVNRESEYFVSKLATGELDNLYSGWEHGAYWLRRFGIC